MTQSNEIVDTDLIGVVVSVAGAVMITVSSPSTFQRIYEVRLSRAQWEHVVGVVQASADSADEKLTSMDASNMGAKLMTITAPELAKLFHETYEQLAPEHGYETRKASAVPWEDVPHQDKSLMIHVAAVVLSTVQLDDVMPELSERGLVVDRVRAALGAAIPLLNPTTIVELAGYMDRFASELDDYGTEGAEDLYEAITKLSKALWRHAT